MTQGKESTSQEIERRCKILIGRYIIAILPTADPPLELPVFGVYKVRSVNRVGNIEPAPVVLCCEFASNIPGSDLDGRQAMLNATRMIASIPNATAGWAVLATMTETVKPLCDELQAMVDKVAAKRDQITTEMTLAIEVAAQAYTVERSPQEAPHAAPIA